VPSGNFWRGHCEPSRSQGWRMQRLADVANGILSRPVLVQKVAACGEIEERQANRNGDTAAEGFRSQR